MFESKHKLRMKISDLEYKIESMQIDLKWAKKHQETAEKKLDEQRVQELQKARDASIYIDWDSVRVISIERRVNDNGISFTEIGHWADAVENNVLIRKHKSMVFWCSEELHEALIEDYESWKRFKD